MISKKSRSRISALLLTAIVWSSLPSGAAAQRIEREPYRNPWLHGGQSLLIPGWGQWSHGQAGRAAIWFFDAALALMFATKVVSFGDSENSVRFWRGVGWAAYGLDAVVSSYDAYRTAQNLNRENGYDLDALENALRRDVDVGVRVTLFERAF